MSAMSAVSIDVPYVKQSDAGDARNCGAACLSMVYRSFGVEMPAEEIWPSIAKVNASGSLASTTHLMTQHALGQGLTAVAIQARHPIHALRLCREAGLRAILNHRAHANSPAGHYSVFVDIDSRTVTLHDPSIGPARRMSHNELLDLWQPRFRNSEIVGGVLIAIDQNSPPLPPCQFCHTPYPLAVECPNCRKPVGLSPLAVLGCMDLNCIARMWNYICCPACDFMWNSETQVPASATPILAEIPRWAVMPGMVANAPGLPEALEALQKFTEHLQSIPAVANHPEIKFYLGLLTEQQAKLKPAFAEAAVYVRQMQTQMAGVLQDAAQRGEALRQAEEEDRKAKLQPKEEDDAPLDGTALGRALLKNLGFTQ